ncbi:uncharacterized protein ACWYII_043599 [Salvelinus alpinus]
MDSAELQRRLTQQEERMEEIFHLIRQPIPTPPMPGKALDWATAIWTANSTELRSETHFHTLFKEVFDHSPSGRPIEDLLIELQQIRNSAAEYALEFRTMAAGSGWNEAALLTVY